MIRSVLKESPHFIPLKGGFPCWKKQTMSCLHSATTTAPTAGIIVIGDEILKGQVRDSNSHFILSRLYNIGVRVMRVSVIGDDIDEISNEVRKFSRLYTYVVTSGGIGPTHDDVTFEGVAKAFEESTHRHPELLKICSNFYKTTDLSSPVIKLATVPRSAKLKYGFDPVSNQRAKYPNISVENVYIFPGIPLLLEKSFTMLCEDLFGGSGSKFYKSDLFINDSEVSIAQHLSMAVEEFPAVTFGSYPQQDNSYFCVKITIEANNSEMLSKATNRLKELLPPNCLVDFDPEPLQSCYEKIESLGLQTGMDHVSAALQEILQAYSSSSPEDTVLCFDASLQGIATLHLIHAVHKKLQKPYSVLTVIVKTNQSVGMDKFIDDIVARYLLHLVGDPSELNSALSALHSSNADLKLLIMGCKSSYTTFKEVLNSVYYDKTVSLLAPVSSWTDSQIFDFIRKLNLPHLENYS